MYGKLFETAFTGTLYGSGPTVFAVWSFVIATAKPPGVVELNPKMLASCIGTDVSDVRQAIEFLCAADPESRNPEQEGRRLVHMGALQYQVVSFEKYRQMISHEEKRAADRIRIAEKRALARMSQDVAGSRGTSQASLNVAEVAQTEAEAEAEAEAVSQKIGRASRFTLTAVPVEWVQFATSERPDLDAVKVFQKFRDYWTAIPGAKGRKLDWFATWRNYCRTEFAPRTAALGKQAALEARNRAAADKFAQGGKYAS